MPPSLTERLPAPLRVLVQELAKFGAVGFVNFLLDVVLFNVLRLTVLDGKPLTAKAISTGVAATSSYFMTTTSQNAGM